ncbi:hypothetical protein ACIA8E_29425 [Streptomyces sp. NPDC051664]|uniref:hypothetical protein n=1 Tax=Streptomyces sp. NPDC051664 TaxID=3365668 RepID=UPI0037B63324
MTVTESDVTAPARTEQVTTVLMSHGFQPSRADGRTVLQLPASMTDREKDRALVRAEAHLNAVGGPLSIRLGPPCSKPQTLPAIAVSAPAQPRTTRSR